MIPELEYTYNDEDEGEEVYEEDVQMEVDQNFPNEELKVNQNDTKSPKPIPKQAAL